ncbi:mycofactocin biosynthesis peptidyl-dipeptidase MftE [Compostimonas suwonensis]|uniref:Creatinine amidohydrolase n=1 Tax=Compostimonas suwonensis TaxID=1048394 RepID=A0A2M9BB60_9MICO|nr:mycofactocin biosynthesis peptidyl-dipeptidase MftE [Compostimonas suwonensis]PJJ55173.1 creatinine amidohydrolase [Compostimonas suwonensis]
MTATSLARSTWPVVSRGAVVLVPTGSVEQHGPHLPLETDGIVATAVAERAAERLRLADPGTAVLVAPTVPYGASGEHQSFPGTVSIGHDALRRMLVELVRSLHEWAGRVVFVNGHGGNVPSLTGAVTQLIAEGHDLAWAPCGVPHGDAHAGRTETSLLLHLVPSSVELDRAEPGNDTPLAELMGQLTAGGVASVSPNGILGDPSGASAEEGEAILEAMVASAVRRIEAGRVDGRGCLRDPEQAAQGQTPQGLQDGAIG